MVLPPVFGGVNFPLPWTTERLFPSRVEFFQSFPFEEEGGKVASG